MDNHEIKGIILDILRLGLLRIRMLGESGCAEVCRREADHLHNLPELVRSFRLELLDYYFTIERPIFLRRNPRGAEAFSSLWDQLEELMKSRNAG